MRRHLVVAAVLTAALALSGCTDGSPGSSDPASTAGAREPSPVGSPNGVQDKSAAAILDASLAAAKKATSVEITGTVKDNGDPVNVDLWLVKGVGSKGTFDGPEGHYDVIAVDGKFYIKASRHFWRKTSGDQAVADLLGGRWLQSPGPKGGQAATLFNANFAKMFRELGVGVKVYKGREAYVDRHRAIGLVDRVDRSTLWVSLDGEPYPLRVAPRVKHKTPESLAFSNWNTVVTIKAPKHPLRQSDLR